MAPPETPNFPDTVVLVWASAKPKNCTIADLVGAQRSSSRPTYLPRTSTVRSATIYFTAIDDANRNTFEAGRTHEITMHKNVRVQQFGSVVASDRATRLRAPLDALRF